MRSLTYLIFFAVIILLSSCEYCTPCKKTEFSGKVVTKSGTGISNTEVKINGEVVATTDERGNFKGTICERRISNDYLVTVRKFGFGLFSKRFNTGFTDRVITLVAGTVFQFDPSAAITLTDTTSGKDPFKPALLNLDTAVLFKTVPKVYDGNGKLIDLGYPDEVKGIFDFLRAPLSSGNGISINIPANAFVDNANNPPPPGTMLQASLSTVDFFNPDGMPGDFIVETQESLGYMESFGAGTIEISDGRKNYQLKKGMAVNVTFPIYPIRLQLKETLPETMPLLHYDEEKGVWKETGKGVLNEEKNAYIAEVNHFSVLNMDIIKTGNSKCFKVRQMLKVGTTSDNSANYLSSYRAQIIVPATTATNFKELDYLVDETTGCVPVPVGANNTTLHPITRLPDTYIAVVFSKVGTSDTLDIVIATPLASSIPAETAVASAWDCTTITCNPAVDCIAPADDPHDINGTSTCNTTCWMPDCGFIPFSNLGTELRIVGVPIGGGRVKVKWVNTNITGSMKITAYAGGGCSGSTTTLFSRCVLNTGCGPGECTSGELIHAAPAGTTVSFKIESFDSSTTDCTGIPIDDCSNNVVVLP